MDSWRAPERSHCQEYIKTSDEAAAQRFQKRLVEHEILDFSLAVLGSGSLGNLLEVRVYVLVDVYTYMMHLHTLCTMQHTI